MFQDSVVLFSFLSFFRRNVMRSLRRKEWKLFTRSSNEANVRNGNTSDLRE